MTGRTFRVSGFRFKVRPGLFFQLQEVKPGDTFEHRGQEFTVDNVVAGPSGGYEVSAHPSAVISREDERCE